MVRDGGGRYGGLRANGAVLRGSVITHIQEEEWSFTVAPLWDKMNGITVFLFQCNCNRSRCQKKAIFCFHFLSFTCCIFRKANNMPRGEPKLKKSVTSKSSGGCVKSVSECEPAVDLPE